MHNQTTNPDPDRLGEANRLGETRQGHPTVHRLGEANQSTNRAIQRYTVQEAAEILGTTVDAIRGRIRRGTLASTKVDGQVYVLLDTASREQHSDEPTTKHADSRQLTYDQAQLIDSLQERIAASEDQIEWLRREVERKDTIIMQMAQRIPELEPAREPTPEPRESPVTASEDWGDGEVLPEQEKRSWWQRWFGG
jgi:uncharacterized small protein (DUF1192 family)